jgi:hypothetical protein
MDVMSGKKRMPVHGPDAAMAPDPITITAETTK